MLCTPLLTLMLLLPCSCAQLAASPSAAPVTNAPTIAPTMAPHSSSNSTVPTKVITKAPTTTAAPATSAPAPAPATAVPVTSVPVTSVPVTSVPSTRTPSKSPVKPPPHDNDGKKNDTKHGGFSFWRMLGKMLAFLILLFLSILGFGAIMNHRYRIFYFLRGLWYTILGLDCTQWFLAKLGLRHRVDTSEMNTVIFDDNEMSYGLLMQENE